MRKLCYIILITILFLYDKQIKLAVYEFNLMLFIIFKLFNIQRILIYI
jgi:hypothetical protein